jgi:hypothetical protein
MEAWLLPCAMACKYSGDAQNIQDDFRAVASGAAEGQLNMPRLLHLPSDDFVTEEQAPRGGHWPKGATYISRDAVSHLMNLRGLSSVPNDPLLIDVRRCAWLQADVQHVQHAICVFKGLKMECGIELHCLLDRLSLQVDLLWRGTHCSFKNFRSVHPLMLVKVF